MDVFEQWFGSLEERHLRELSFQEVRRGVQALSSLYVERRGRIRSGSAFDGAGKRAAFAYFWGPLHFLLVREIVRRTGAANRLVPMILDLGCGTGVAGAAWALEMDPHPRLAGVDRHPWVVQEARWTYSTLGLSGSARVMPLEALRIPAHVGIIAAFTINELPETTRNHFMRELFNAAGRGSPVLIIEPIANRLASWWSEWREQWPGVQEDEWRFRLPLPERLALMDKAAGLNHRELTGRSLWLPGR